MGAVVVQALRMVGGGATEPCMHGSGLATHSMPLSCLIARSFSPGWKSPRHARAIAISTDFSKVPVEAPTISGDSRAALLGPLVVAIIFAVSRRLLGCPMLICCAPD